MRRTRRSRLTSEVSTSSLNDIMFMLLLFFLIISTMVNPNVIKLMLPKANGQPVMAKKMINITVDAERNIAVDNVPVSLEMLETTLLAKTKDVLDPAIILSVDQSLNVQDFVNILDVGAKLKLKVVLAVQTK